MLYRPLTPTSRVTLSLRHAAASVRQALDNLLERGRDARYLDDASDHILRDIGCHWPVERPDPWKLIR